MMMRWTVATAVLVAACGGRVDAGAEIVRENDAGMHASQDASASTPPPIDASFEAGPVVAPYEDADERACMADPSKC